MVRTIRGTTGKWWPERNGVGYYAAFMEFEDGATASVTNNGYGYSMTADLTPWSDEQGRGLIEGYTHDDRVRIRADLRAGTRDEFEAKDSLRIGSDHERRFWRETPAENPPWRPTNLGILIRDVRARRPASVAATGCMSTRTAASRIVRSRFRATTQAGRT